MRAFLAGSLLSGAAVWGLLGLALLVDLLNGLPETTNPQAYVFYLLGVTVGVAACLLLWRSPSFRDDEEWELTTRGKKFLAFTVTPWGVVLGLTIGAVALMFWMLYEWATN